MILPTIAIALTALLPEVFAGDNLCGSFYEPCPEGCWNDGGFVFFSGQRICVPTESGFFSPANDDKRYPCQPGHYTELPNATSCTACPIGTFALEKSSTTCTPCPTGSFNSFDASETCSECDPGIYDGLGSEYILILGGIKYCLSPGSTNEFLSESPTASPSQAPSVTATSAPSLLPKDALSNVPTTSDNSQSPSASPSNRIPNKAPSTPPSTESSSLVPSKERSEKPETSSPSSAPTNSPVSSPEHSEGGRSFEGLESWQYLLILAALGLLFLAVQRCFKEYLRRTRKPRTVPPPPSEQKPSVEVTSGDTDKTHAPGESQEVDIENGGT